MLTKMHLPSENYIDVKGIKTCYRKAGKLGIPLLLIHGAGAASEYWYKKNFKFAERHQVYALDLVGSGK